MKILSLSTSTDICSVAILENNKILDELHTTDKKTHSVNLMPLISEILEKNSIDISNINIIACDIGPGSFTGIRIGVATAKSLAVVNNLPIIAVTSLEALAYASGENEKTKCVLLDANNRQVYCGIFDSKYKLLQDYLANDIDIVSKEFEKYKNIEYIGNGAENYLNIPVFTTHFLATHIGLFAYEKYLNGEMQNADTLIPLYLRVSGAERTKQ